MSMVTVEATSNDELWKKFEEDTQCYDDYPNGVLNRAFDRYNNHKFPLDWVEANVGRIMDRFKSVVQKRAEEIYDAPVWVESIYQYSDELYKKMLSEVNHVVSQDKGIPHSKLKLFSEIYATISVSHEQLTKRNGQPADLIKVQRLTSLRKLSGDYKWSFAPEGSIRPTDVRYAIRRQLSYLYKQKGVVMISGGSGAFDHVKKGAAGGRRSLVWLPDSAVRILQKNLPMAYPTKLAARIKQEKFHQEHPMFDEHVSSYRHEAYQMYKLGGEAFLAYAGRANGEVTMVDRGWGDPVQQNRLHDAIYPFAGGALEWLTKATFKKCMTFSINKNQKLLESLGSLMGMQKLNLKEKRKLAKTVVFSEDPIKTALGMIDELSQKLNQKLYRLLRAKPEQVRSFISRMQVYATGANLQQMINLFGNTGTGKMLRGEYPGLFKPASYPVTKGFIAKEILIALGDRGVGATVSNPKRLFKHLSKIGNVKDMLEGRIEHPERVLSVLRHMGHEMPKEHEQALTIRAEVEPKCSPEFLIAGNASVCCMSFGATNAQSYARNKGFGVLNFYLGDRIIANSVLWINKLRVGQALVFDNIEVAPNYKRFNPYLQELYLQVADTLMAEYDCILVAQGNNYSDLKLPEIQHPMKKYAWKIDALDVPETNFYTDANRVTPVATAQSEEEARLWDLMVQAQLREEYGPEETNWTEMLQPVPEPGIAQVIPLINEQTGHVNPQYAFPVGDNNNHIDINIDLPF